MKKVVLVRHGKAETWGYSIKDHQRKLIAKGRLNSEKMSAVLKEQGIFPDEIITSDAARSVETAVIFAEALGSPVEDIKKLHWLYEDVVTADFVQLLQSIDNEKETVFVFGHNPWMSGVAYKLSGNFSELMPTCAFVIIEFPIEDWSELEARTGTVSQYEIPKNIS